MSQTSIPARCYDVLIMVGGSAPFDLVGIGFGPANLSLAIALEESVPGARVHFLEAREDCTWQEDMLLDGSDIQNHPSRDLVTLRNPRSRYSFLNFLFEEGRLVQHLNLPAHFPLRKEYARYIQWASRFFAGCVDYLEAVSSIETRGAGANQEYCIGTRTGKEFRARAISLGTGRTPFIPPPFEKQLGPRVCHSSRYRRHVSSLPAPPRRAIVVGGSQSAVEVTLDLAQRFPAAEVLLMTRTPGLALKDTSPFSEEGYFPEFTNYYRRASRRSKMTLDGYMRRTNYSSTDGDILVRLYLLMYEQSLDGGQRVFLKPNRQCRAIQQIGQCPRLIVDELHTGEVETWDADLVVAATGYRDLGPGLNQEPFPPLLEDVIDQFTIDSDGYLVVEADYSLTPKQPSTLPLYLNGLCESTHGIGDAGSFSLLSLRAQIIVDSLRRQGILS